MLKETLTVRNQSGIHARPATMLAKLSKRYESHIELVHNDKTIKMKSVLSILSAGIKRGSVLEVVCNGYDEQDAMTEIKALFASGFGED